MTPEVEKLIENSNELTRIHTHPLGIYDIAGYNSDQIVSVREGLIPVPLSLPPSIPDLLSAKLFSEMQQNDGTGIVKATQKIYGTVFNSKGDLLPYSSVTIKGTTIGASANNRAYA